MVDLHFPASLVQMCGRDLVSHTIIIPHLDNTAKHLSNKQTPHSVMRHFTTPDHQYKADLAQSLLVVNLIMA
jgi:hypothetical protein